MAALSQEQLASLTTMEEAPAEQGVSQTPTSSKVLSNADLFNLTSSIIETPQQAQPTAPEQSTMDNLVKNQDWLRDAKTIYKHEKGEDYRGPRS